MLSPDGKSQKKGLKKKTLICFNYSEIDKLYSRLSSSGLGFEAFSCLASCEQGHMIHHVEGDMRIIYA